MVDEFTSPPVLSFRRGKPMRTELKIYFVCLSAAAALLFLFPPWFDATMTRGILYAEEQTNQWSQKTRNFKTDNERQLIYNATDADVRAKLAGEKGKNHRPPIQAFLGNHWRFKAWPPEAYDIGIIGLDNDDMSDSHLIDPEINDEFLVEEFVCSALSIALVECLLVAFFKFVRREKPTIPEPIADRLPS